MGKELSHVDFKDPKKQMEDGLKELRKGFERKLREEFGPQIIDGFLQRIEYAISRVPQIPSVYDMRYRIEEITKSYLSEFKKLLDDRIKNIMASEFEAAVKRVWIDFIRNEINLKLEDPATIIKIAKKLKELP